MKKVVLIDMQAQQLAISPARYQLLAALAGRGYETYAILLERPGKKERFPYIEHVIQARGMSTAKIRKKVIDIAPDAVIASFHEDMKVVWILPFIMKDTVFYHYNLEIFTPYISKEVMRTDPKRYFGYKAAYPVRKLQEIVYTHHTALFTIQDDLRRRVSAKYHIRHKNTLLIPNSYVFDRSMTIDAPCEGILYTGGIKRDFLIGQFEHLKKVKNVQVTFSGYIDTWCRERIAELRRTNPNIRFMDKKLSPQEHTELVRRFAVGLVWYSPVREDEARYHIGLSSGKMFKSLSLGQPVIAVESPGISAVVKKYGLGVVIDDISGLEDAYRKIIAHYPYYRENVIRTYERLYDFNKVIKPFLDCIDRDTDDIRR